MGYTFYWKGYPQSGKHLHGVGLAIKNTLLPKLTETPVGISERLMTLRIPPEKNRYATLLSVYAPTLPSDSESKDSFTKHWIRLSAGSQRMIRSSCLGSSMLELGRTVEYGREYLAGMGLVRPTQMV